MGDTRAARVSRVLAGVALVVMVAGCGSNDAPPASTGATATVTTTARPAAPATTRSAPRPRQVSLRALRGDIATAVAAVDDFWARRWSFYFTGTYTPPEVRGTYDGADPATTPRCDGDPLLPGNAYYCVPEDFLAWDASLMLEGYRYGDAWVYLVVAHEWGHAIQNRLDAGLQSVTHELQADCLAAAALYGAVELDTLTWERGDTRELVTSLNAISDDMPWTELGDHGDSFERIEAFNTGRLGGVTGCLPSQ